jgi:phage terminase large subunit-like protein
MRWATNNAKLAPAPHDNFTYGKIEPHGRKTDPFMALVAAFAAVDKLDEPKQATVEDLSFIMPITM